MVIEVAAFIDQALQYGIAGLWIAYMVVDKHKFQGRMVKVMSDHTDAIKGLHVTLSRINGRLK